MNPLLKMKIKTNKHLVTALSKTSSARLSKLCSNFKTEEMNRHQISRFPPPEGVGFIICYLDAQS